MKRSQAGVTLIEVLIAVTLLSMLSVAMLFAMRTGLNTYEKANGKLMDGRRVAGAQRVLLQEIEGLMPVATTCLGAPELAPVRFAFFQGETQAMRFVSTFSLQEGWRGRPQVLEFLVIPGEQGRGVRLVVNEIPFTGALDAGRLCIGIAPEPENRGMRPVFAPISTGPQSFVLADDLAFCRFAYFSPPAIPLQPAPLWTWTDTWRAAGWPRGIRIEMAPREADPSRVQPITVVAPVRLRRNIEVPYGDS